MKTLFTIIIFCVSVSVAMAQLSVRGVITDAQGDPLFGATVIEVGNRSNGAVSDAQGTFFITVQGENTELEVSYLGFLTQKVRVEGGSLSITMEEEAQSLGGVSVLGFPTVTGKARKRLENIQDIGETITAFSSEQLESQGIASIGDALKKIPNASFNNYQDAGNFTINIRGITSVRNGELPVSVVVDDIQLSVTEQLVTDFYEIEQIEVLKGPQGTLYGRNAIGGAINFITKQPSEEISGKVKASYATGSDLNLLGTLNGAIVSNVLYASVAGSYRDFAGYENQRNTFLDELTNYSEEYSMRGQLVLEASQDIRLTLRGQMSELDAGAYPYIQTADDGTGASDFSGKPQANELGATTLSTADINFKAEFRTDAGRFMSITSYADGEYTSRGDLDHTSTPVLLQFSDRAFKAWNQESRFVSRQFQNFNFITGLFYQNKETTPSFQAGSDDGDGYDNITLFPASISVNTNNTYAAFGQGTFKLSDQVEVTGGLRYDVDVREQYDQTNLVIREETFTQLQPKLGLSFKPTASTLLYATYSVGYRSGGFNAPRSEDVSVANPNQFEEAYDKEVTNNIELGIKNSLFDNRLILNASLFRTQFENEQVYVVDLGTVTTGIFNLEEVVNQGLELEAKYRAFSFLDVGGSLGLIDSEIKQADIATFFVQENGDTGGSWEGNVAPFVSDHTLTFFTDFHLGEFSLFADINKLGNFYWHPDNFDVQDPYTLVNFKASYTFEETITLSLFGNNIFDVDYNQEYFSKEFSTAALDLRYPAAPAVFGIELLAKF